MIEIRELIIRARIDENAQKGGGAAASTPTQAMSGHDMDKIISMCAEEVMKAIKRQTER